MAVRSFTEEYQSAKDKLVARGAWAGAAEKAKTSLPQPLPLPTPQVVSRNPKTKAATPLPTAGKAAGLGLAMLPTAADLSAGQPANTTAFDIDPATVGTRSAPIVGLPNADQRIGLAAGSIGQTLAATPAVAIDTWKQYVKNSKVQGAVGLTDDYLDLEKERSALANRMDYMERYQYPTRAAARESEEYKALAARRVEISAALAGMIADAGGNAAVPMDSKGMQKMTQAIETREKALEGMTGAPRWLAEQGISIGQNLALLPTAAINPALPLVGMGAISAGDKMYELNAQGKSPDEALGRGLVAGGIEAATEKIPLDTLMSVVKTGGKSALKNLLKQAGVEAGEESLSYVMNFIADKGAKDPNASFSLPELASAAAGGAFSGLVMGVLGTAGNRMSGYLPRAGEARMGQELQPLPKAGETGQLQPVTMDPQAQKTASTGEADSTAVNTDPAQHTPAEQAIIKEYQGAVDENLVDFYNAAKNEATAKKGAKPYLLKPVSERTSTDILNLTGVDTSGFETRFDVKQANHIFLDHGEDGRADHSMADAHDIGRIQYVLDHYDHADAWGTTGAYWETTAKGRNRQAKTVLLSKKVNGTYYVVEATPDTKARSVYIVSAYMLEEGKLPPGNAGKNTTGATSQLTDAQRPQRNGQTATANVSPVSAPIIADSSAGGNTQSAQNAGGVTGAGPLPRAEEVQGGMQYLPRVGEVQTDTVAPPVESQFDYARKAQEVQKNGIFTGEYRRAFERSGLKYEDAEAALAKIAGGDTGRGDPDVRRVMDILDGSDGRSGTYARSGQVITGRDPLPRAGQAQGVSQPLPRAGEAQAGPDFQPGGEWVQSQPVTTYTKKGNTTSEMNADQAASIRTSETPEPVLPSAPIIADSPAGGNTQGAQNVGRVSQERSAEEGEAQKSSAQSAAVEKAKSALDTFLDNQERDPEEFADARVRTGIPEDKVSVRDRAKDTWHYAYRKMVDSGEAVGRAGKTLGDSTLYAYYNFARAASNAAGNALEKGGAQTDINGKRVGVSLADLWEPIRTKGDDYYRAFENYLFHKHNVDRMSRDNRITVAQAKEALDIFDEGAPALARMPESDLAAEAAWGDEMAVERLQLLNEYNRAKSYARKPVFGFEVSAEDSAAAAGNYEREHPEFKDLAEQVYRYNQNLMQYRVDSGLLTQEQAEFIEKTYPHYVPTYRITEGAAARAKKSGKQISSTVGRATGGEADLLPLHVAMARQTQQVIREGAKNRFGVRLMTDAEKNRTDGGKFIHQIQEAEHGRTDPDIFDALEDLTPKTANTFTVRQDGKAWELVLDKDLYEGVEALDGGKPPHWVLQKVRAVNDLYKSLITGYNPMFSAKNFARDLQEAGLYSKDPTAWAANYPQAVNEIRTNGAWWQRYQALGGAYSSVFDYQKGYQVEQKDHGGLRQKTMDKVEALNMAVEQAPRLAEFMAQVKKTGESTDSLMDAMLAAADVTTNFGRSGSWGKTLNQTFVPFLNPSVQGLDKMGRTFLGGKSGKAWLGLIARCMILGILPGIANELLNQDEPGWEDVRQSDKDAYWLISVGNGKYLRIPKGRDMSVIGMFADRMGAALHGDEVDMRGTLRTAANQIAPPNPMENNIYAAWADADLFDPKSPGKTWYGGDIEGRRLQTFEPGQRFDENTDAVSKAIGGALGLSPKKLSYLMDQYTGVIGDFALPMMTPSGDKNPLSPFARTFVLDTASNNKVSGEFYDAGDKITYAKNGGDGAMALVSRFWNRKSGEVSDIYAEIREAENSRELPNAKKMDQVRSAKSRVTEVQKDALEVLEQYETAARKYYTGDSTKEIDTAYRQANRDVFGAEYALQVYNRDTYAKAQELNRKGIGYDDFYDVYFDGYKDISNMEGSAADKTTEFVHWLTENGYSEKQVGAFRDALAFYSHIPTGETLYDRLQGAGFEERQAYDLSKVLADVSGIKGDKYANGKTINLSASRNKKAAIDAATPNLTREQRKTLYEVFEVSERVWR